MTRAAISALLMISSLQAAAVCYPVDVVITPVIRVKIENEKARANANMSTVLGGSALWQAKKAEELAAGLARCSLQTNFCDQLSCRQIQEACWGN
jgi:hypothetical protein